MIGYVLVLATAAIVLAVNAAVWLFIYPTILRWMGWF